MKRAIIVHGWDGSPKEPMLNWIRKQSEKLGFKVFVPQMPNPSEPDIHEWVAFLKKNIKEINEETILIGHSMGCRTILKFLEDLSDNIKINKCIFIAPWIGFDEKRKKILAEEGEEVLKIAKSWEETPINWSKIKNHCNNFICIFSDNDPYVALFNKEIFKKELGAKTLLLKNKGHFNLEASIKELPEILEFI